MADKAKTESSTASAGDESGGAIKGTKPVAPAKLGRSPLEIDQGNFPYDDRAFDPEEQPVAAEDAGAIGYAGSSQENYNDPYISGAGIYAPPIRNKD